MELNIEKTQQLEKLLAKPTLVTQEHIPFLQNLIEDYPYFQPLYLLLAKAKKGAHDQQNTLTKAALYTNGGILHRVLNEPHLQSVEEINIINNPLWENQQQINIAIKRVEETPIPAIPVETSSPATVVDAPEIENLEPLPHEVILKEPSEEEEKPETIKTAALEGAQTTPQDFVVPEIENLKPLQSEVINICEPSSEVGDDSNHQEIKETDEQETFEEIGEVTLIKEHLSNEEITALEVEATTTEEDQEFITAEPEEIVIENSAIEVGDQNTESLTQANFFAFEPSFETESVQEEEENIVEIEETPIQLHPEKTTEEIPAKEHIISKYDDDKLPFTFLWWLTKTRKDHEQIFRPFASPAKTDAPVQDLQQQYVENIFHIQAPFEPGQEVKAPTTEAPTKESKIIDSFIKNDPQIKALKPNQINNENKAKRSAEDNYDMVSETLAQIYIEQMLYHKAIDTYQKLSLKYPEKSRYFADLIQSLEKKI